MVNKTVTILKGYCRETPCQLACPAGVDVPRYIRLVEEKQFSKAIGVIRERVPLPAVLGHVCTHPCEEKCRRGEIDKPVAINALKRVATEQYFGSWREYFNLSPPTGRKLAIVGSGPTGLTAAYYLTKLGHEVTVFEALPVIGGMMRVGIPGYRLPREVLDREIDEIRSIGFEIRTNMRIDSLDKLINEGYDAILLAMGAFRGIRLMVEGNDTLGVVDGVTLLRKVSLGEKANLGDTVAVIGGGNVAIDSARTALRLGCKKVNIVYRRTKNEMPARPEDLRTSIYEGAEVTFLAAPERIKRKNAKLQLDCVCTELGEPDASGRPRPIPIQGSRFSIDCDSVVVAIGQTPDIPTQFNLKMSTQNTILVDTETLASNRQGVFAGGDVVTGPASVIEAISAGRKAASSIDRYLGGNGDIKEELVPAEEPAEAVLFEESIFQKRRQPMPWLSKDKCLASFAEVELGFSKNAATEEASRCLKCGQQVMVAVSPDKCTECHRCRMICSLVYQGVFNPERAKILINLPEISWAEGCIGGCGLCIQRCLNEAISFE